jgi:hypothetical protein
MNNSTNAIQHNNHIVLNLIGWIFGIAVFAVGVINTFWGNDPGFGVFLILLAFVFFPPVNMLIKEKFGFAIPLIARILLAIFIIWAAFGVGELLHKIELMMQSL